MGPAWLVRPEHRNTPMSLWLIEAYWGREGDRGGRRRPFGDACTGVARCCGDLLSRIRAGRHAVSRRSLESSSRTTWPTTTTGRSATLHWLTCPGGRWSAAAAGGDAAGMEPAHVRRHPVLANPQTGFWSLFSVPLWILPFDYAVGVEAALKLWAAAFGTYLLCRQCAEGECDACQTLPAVAALLPWMIWFVERILARGRLGDALGLALATAIGLGGGHPGRQVQVLVGTGLYVLLRIVLSRDTDDPRRLRAAGLAAGGLCMGVPAMGRCSCRRCSRATAPSVSAHASTAAPCPARRCRSTRSVPGVRLGIALSVIALLLGGGCVVVLVRRARDPRVRRRTGSD